MPNRSLWNKNVPGNEYGHRARDTRLRLEHIERLLVKQDAARGFRYFGLLLLLFGSIAGNRRRTGSPNNRRPYHIGPATGRSKSVGPISAEIKQVILQQ